MKLSRRGLLTGALSVALTPAGDWVLDGQATVLELRFTDQPVSPHLLPPVLTMAQINEAVALLKRNNVPCAADLAGEYYSSAWVHER